MHITTTRSIRAGPELVKKLYNKGTLGHVVIPAITYESNVSVRELFKEDAFPYVYFAAGIHSKAASHMNPRNVEWSVIEQLLDSERTVGIKTGLDFSNNELTMEQIKNQIVICERFMDLAYVHYLPLVFHLKDSVDWFLKVMDFKVLPTEAEIHCYMGDYEQAKKLMNSGVNYFGIGGSITRDGEQYDLLRDCVQKLPMSTILLETDSPFQKPLGFQGELNDSSSLFAVAQKIGIIKGITAEEVIHITNRNAYDFFGING